MRVTVEQIDPKHEEELIVRCYDPGAAWVSSVTEAASGQRTICGWQEDTMHRLKLAEVFYFEVVDDLSFLYTQAAVFEAKENIPAQKLYRKTGFDFCGEADMYGHSYFLCERTIEICLVKENDDHTR